MLDSVDLSNPPDKIYQAEFIRGLFDEMSATYGTVNVISSFGFCIRWRQQCIRLVRPVPGNHVIDLMSGMGELWPMVAKYIGSKGRITGVDFSEAMCRNSKKTTARLPELEFKILQEDVLNNSIPDNSADIILSSFGLKTFTTEQRKKLAEQAARILRPGGRISFVEISVPSSRLLKIPYLFYLNYIIPLLGWALLGNPNNYRMLGIYTTEFGNCSEFAEQCTTAGLNVYQKRMFFGCATAVVEVKPLKEDKNR